MATRSRTPVEPGVVLACSDRTLARSRVRSCHLGVAGMAVSVCFRWYRYGLPSNDSPFHFALVVCVVKVKSSWRDLDGVTVSLGSSPANAHTDSPVNPNSESVVRSKSSWVYTSLAVGSSTVMSTGSASRASKTSDVSAPTVNAGSTTYARRPVAASRTKPV
jgi:hypothetical protein